MNVRTAYAAATLLLVGMTVGCGSSQGVVRGQSPVTQAEYVTADGKPVVTPVGHCKECEAGGSHAHGGPAYETFGPGPYAGSYGPHGGYGPAAAGHGCPYCHGAGHGCPHCQGSGHSSHGAPDGYGIGHHGIWKGHYRTVQYDWPTDLQYPQPVSPAALVQYPYYPVKGPSDFFMK